ncbi:MAG TPA: Wzz/FepE/Etk N-terminal domain-containing protein, partial [Myxococcota bacterium]|nr:Wzz/FepE/Etk N-terminal domain-containing protein [Myxococcota bacterium]
MPPGSTSRPHRPRRRMDDDTVESLTEMLHLRDYWRTVQKRIWTLITAFCLIVGSVTVVTLLMTPVYESTASIQIDAQPQAYANFQSIGQYGSGQYLSDQEYFNTQHRKLRSRVQAQAVIDELHLLERPEFSDVEDPVASLLEMVTIEPVPKTRLVWVYVRINNAELAQEINQAWVEIFVRRNMDELNQGVKQAIFFLKDAQDNSLKELTDAERELYDFRRKNNLIAGSSDDKDNLYQQHL